MTIANRKRAAIRARVDELLARDRFEAYALDLSAADALEVMYQANERYKKIREKRLGKNLLATHEAGE